MGPFEVTEAIVWRHSNGGTASPYGACPWTNDNDKPNWRLEIAGYTLLDASSGTVGIGRVPFATRDEAQALADKLNAKSAERYAMAARLRRKRFRDAYEAALTKLVNGKSEEYAYPPSDVPIVAERMVNAMARGSANLGPAAKSAAKACGIRPTVSAIKAFLTE